MTVLLTIATSMAVTLPELVAVFNPDEPVVQQIILDVAGGVAFVGAMACEYLRQQRRAIPAPPPTSESPPAATDRQPSPANGLTQITTQLREYLIRHCSYSGPSETGELVVVWMRRVQRVAAQFGVTAQQNVAVLAMACLEDNCLNAIFAAQALDADFRQDSMSWELLRTLLLRLSPWNAEIRALDMLEPFQREPLEPLGACVQRLLSLIATLGDMHVMLSPLQCNKFLMRVLSPTELPLFLATHRVGDLLDRTRIYNADALAAAQTSLGDALVQFARSAAMAHSRGSAARPPAAPAAPAPAPAPGPGCGRCVVHRPALVGPGRRRPRPRPRRLHLHRGRSLCPGGCDRAGGGGR